MKKLFILIVVALLGMGVALAQESKSAARANISAGMKYGSLKNIYDYKEYKTFDFSDAKKKYSVAGNGFASFFIPGLGQWIAGEGKLGCAYFFPAIVAGGVAAGGIYLMWAGTKILEGVSPTQLELSALRAMGGVLVMALGVPVFILGLGGYLAVDICAIKNAVRISKVKNMYYDDLGKMSSFDLKITPYVDVLANSYAKGGMSPVAGLSLKLNF